MNKRALFFTLVLIFLFPYLTSALSNDFESTTELPEIFKEKISAIENDSEVKIDQAESHEDALERERITRELYAEGQGGYIIEFNEKSLLQKELDIREQLRENQEYINRTSRLNPKRVVKKYFGVTTEQKVQQALAEHAIKLDEEHEKVKSNIYSTLSTPSTNSEISIMGRAILFLTGKEIEPLPDEVQDTPAILEEYGTVFNGVALAINDSQAEDIAKIPGVNRVMPNRKVQLFVKDAAQIIEAQSIWGLNTNLQNCGYSENGCVTGKGVKIAVLDTGIDYTHPDLGGCTQEDIRSKNCKKIVHAYDFSGDKKITFEKDIISDDDVMDYQGHGTHVAATAAGNSLGLSISYEEGAYISVEPSSRFGFDENFILWEKIEIPISHGDNNLPVSKIHLDVYKEYGSMELLLRGELLKNKWESIKVQENGQITFTINNEPYFIHIVPDEKNKINISVTWGTGASAGDPGVFVSKPRLGLGYNGIAPDASLYIYKIFPNSYDSIILKALEASIDPNGDRDFSDRADVISMSFGGPGDPNDYLSIAVDSIVKGGSVAVISAGNSGPTKETIGSPGTSRKAITVGASSKEDNVSFFSSQGPVRWKEIVFSNDSLKDAEFNSQPGPNRAINKPDVLAPGVKICAAGKFFIDTNTNTDSANKIRCLRNPDEAHIAISGTSMAAPIVSGVVALIIQAHPDWTPEEIKAALKNSAWDLGEPQSVQGAGRIGAFDAITLRSPPPVAELEAGKIHRVIEHFEVRGSAYGRHFQDYRVYLKNSVSGDIIEICTEKLAVKDNILCPKVSLESFHEGIYQEVLEVRATDGQTTIESVPFEIDYLEITEPESGLVYRKGGNLTINGRLEGLWQDYYFEYSPVGSESWTSLGITTMPLQKGKLQSLAYWDTSLITQDGAYDLRLLVTDHQGQFEERITNIYLDGTIKQGWPITYRDILIMPHTVGDVLGDDNEEIIVGGVRNIGNSNAIRIYDSNGNLKNILAGEPLVTLSDLNRDGKSEVITSNKKQILAYSEGRMLPGFPIETDLNGIYGIAATDLDADGNREIVVTGYAEPGKGKILAYTIDKSQGTVTLAKGWPQDIGRIGSWYYGPPAIADLNNDTSPEVIAYYNSSMVRIYSFDGKVSGEFSNKAFGFTPPIVADLDGDGMREIVVIGRNDNKNGFEESYDVLILDKEGKLLSSSPVPGYYFMDLPHTLARSRGNTTIIVPGQVKNAYTLHDKNGKSYFNQSLIDFNYGHVVEDITSDGVPDIIVAGSRNVYAYSLSGEVLPGWPKKISRGDSFSLLSRNPPVIKDIDKNGLLDVVATVNVMRKSNSNLVQVFVWEVGNVSNRTDTWPMFQHDAELSACLDCGK